MNCRNAILTVGLMLVFWGSAEGASILVNTAEDELNSDGDCSLREAIETANTGAIVDNCNRGSAGEDTITVLIDGSIPLGQELTITDALTIQGLGRLTTTLSGSTLTRVIRIDAPGSDILIRDLALANGYTDNFLGGAGALVECADTVRLESLRIVGNEAAGTGGGGAILVNPDTDCNTRLEISDSIVVFNQSAGPGGGLQVDNVPLVGSESTRVDSVLIESSHFLQNTSAVSGGAVHVSQVPVLVIADSLFEENQVTPREVGSSRGGAIDMRQGNSTIGTVLAQIERSSFTSNFAETGGALHVSGDLAASLRNSTIYGNNSATPDQGAAIALGGSSSLAVFHSTIVGNGSGIPSDVGLLVTGSATASLAHSIIATAWPTTSYCTTADSGAVQSAGFNIDSGSSCAAGVADFLDTDPALRDPESFTRPAIPFDQVILIPQEGSPAIDGGAAGTCPGPFGGNTSADQRGEARPVSAAVRGTGPICDIGAIEFQSGDRRVIFRDRFQAGG